MSRRKYGRHRPPAPMLRRRYGPHHRRAAQRRSSNSSLRPGGKRPSQRASPRRHNVLGSRPRGWFVPEVTAAPPRGHGEPNRTVDLRSYRILRALGERSPMSALKVNAPRMVHETVDDEVIVIDLATGAYYSLAGSAAHIWALIAAGVAGTELADRVARDYGIGVEPIPRRRGGLPGHAPRRGADRAE